MGDAPERIANQAAGTRASATFSLTTRLLPPGFIDTPLFQSVIGQPSQAEFAEKIKEQHKIGRFGRPEEIADAVVYLASDRSSFVTGHALWVDGGIAVNSHMI